MSETMIIRFRLHVTMWRYLLGHGWEKIGSRGWVKGGVSIEVFDNPETGGCYVRIPRGV